MRSIETREIPASFDVLSRLVNWANRATVSCLLTSNQNKDRYGAFDMLLGIAAHTQLVTSTGHAFDELSQYRKETQDYILGFLTYDLKNELEDLDSNNPDHLEFPELYFFQPEKLVKLTGNQITFMYLPHVADEIEVDYQALLSQHEFKNQAAPITKPKIQVRFNRDAYCSQVNKMLDHIHRGDIYEANFCQEFYAEAAIDPVKSFLHLNEISEAPFAAFFKKNGLFALCSSPERFLVKRGAKLISQPIKGTAPRHIDHKLDTKLASMLAQDAKERSENIMITDLVRNDLSKKARKGSVVVEELCKVYSFKQVHQMISTISAEIDLQEDPIELLKMAYPMGSMTGAPKVSAMQIIEELENHRRGLYSGSIGYFEPNGDFDFNVVIRSILYNAAKPYVSFSVGSAITAPATASKEYEECLLKAKAMREALEI